MIVDIVERLNAFASLNSAEVEVYQYDHAFEGHIATEAAAEITRLRALVQRSCTHHSRLFNPSGGWQCPLCDARGPA